jgi:competence protein ComEA
MEQVNEILDKYKLPLLLGLVGGVLVLGGLYSNFTHNSFFKSDTQNFPKESIVSSQNASNGIKVDVSGAVKTPGVYSFSSDSRIEDAIKRSGGFLENADKEYISKKLNLSQKLADGLKIYIPFNGEQFTGTIALANAAGAATGGLIGINSSDQKLLESLPGVGAVTAQKIISGRPYATLEDLKYKKVVTSSVFEKIKDQIDLN